MVSDTVKLAAIATCKSFSEAVGEQRVGSVTLEQVKLLLTHVELFSKDHNNLNWHVHVSGYDKGGKVFWLPIYEDAAICESPAAHALGLVYRYAESGSCMEAMTASILTETPSSRLTLPPAARAERAVPRGRRVEGGGKKEDAEKAVTVDGGGAAACGAAAGWAVGGGQGPAQGAGTDIAGAASDQPTAADDRLAAAQAAAAAVIEAEGAGDLPPPAVVGDAVQPRRSTMAAAAAGAAATCVVAPRPHAGTAVGGGRAGINPNQDDPRAGLDDGDGGSGDETEDELAAAAAGARSRPSRKVKRVKRVRRDWERTAPATVHPPNDYLPIDAAVSLSKAVLECPERVTQLRKVAVIGNAVTESGMFWPRARLSLPWWPRQIGCEKPWPLRVMVNNPLIHLGDPKHATKEGAVRVVLPHMNIARSSTLACRIAELMALVDKCETAHAAISGYISKFNPKVLPPIASRGSQRPSLSGLSGLRAAPRIAPTPSAFALQHADPRRPGDLFSGGSLRPTGWVANGSQPPTHHVRMAPPDLPAPLPPIHPAVLVRSIGTTSSAATSAAAAAEAATAALRATLVARAVAEKPRAS